MNKDTQQVNPYPIRLTKELREQLEVAAKAEGRSLNAEMLLRLEASFATGTVDSKLTADDVRHIALQVVREELARQNQ